MPIVQPAFRPRASKGVTLIEILVGIAIGLIGILVIFQTLTVWDARTRVSASSGDAQVAGSLAMFNVERDLRLAGMGFGNAGVGELGCNVNAFDNVASGAAPFSLRPISITDGDLLGQPDSIEVLYGNSAFFVQNENFVNGTGTTLVSDNKYGFKRGDLAVMSDRAGTCRLIQITDDTSPDSFLLTFGTGVYSDYYDGNPAKPVRWNSAAASMPLIANGNLYNMGPSPRRDDWQIDPATSTLGFFNRMSAVNVNQFFGVAEGVVDMKAQYGYDADSDGKISDAEWTKVQPVDWTKLRAVRIALLVRGRDFEKPPSASDAESPNYRLTVPPAWSGGNFVMKNVDGTADTDVLGSPNNWRYYRYRVYEKVIPLRNMIWGQQ